MSSVLANLFTKKPEIGSIQSFTSKFLASSFKPISISAPAREWKRLDYKNRLFNVEINPRPEYLRFYDNNEYKKSTIIFSAPYFTHIKSYNNTINSPATFMANIIGGSDFIDNNPSLEVYTKKDDEIITFNTMGKIPNRWIRMLHDFYFKESTIVEKDENKEVDEFWDNKVLQIPESTLNSLFNLSNDIMTKSMSIKVIKAPLYSEDDLYKIYKTSNLVSVIENQELSDRVWKTRDGSFSAPVKVFINNCKKYKSYYPGIFPERSIYTELFACEGGFDAIYFRNLPWYKYRKFSNFSSNYVDMKGNDCYYTSRYIPVDELVILEEVLKKEGAEIKIDI